MVEEERRSELAEFLRSRRARLHPADVQLPNAGRRRASGLRREEVAWLAGVSVDYYARLEQSRVPRPSGAILAALARTFGLSEDERAYLFRIGGVSGPPSETPCREVPAGIHRLLERLTTIPAYVLDATYDVLAWNPLAEAVMFGDFSAPQAQRNGLRAMFTGRGNRLHPADWEGVARATVADLRATAARYPDDPAVHTLVDELLASSPKFACFWSDHEVAIRGSGRYRILHPDVGLLDLDYEMLHLPDRDQRLMLYSAEPGTPSFERLMDLGRALHARSAPRLREDTGQLQE